MDKRIFNFMLLSMTIWISYSIFIGWMFPAPPPVKKVADAQPAEKKPADAKGGAEGEKPAGEKPAVSNPAGEKPVQVAAPVDVPPAWTTLGSLDEASPYRMLVTFSNRGAAVERIELNHKRYHDVDNIRPLGGYLGHLAPQNIAGRQGCRVAVVGAGTPSEAAGVKVGDILVALDDEPLADALAFAAAMRKTKPKQTVNLAYERDGERKSVAIVLRPHPLELAKREAHDPAQPDVIDPASFLLTIDRLDDTTLDIDQAELPNVGLRDGLWEILPADAAKPNEVAFRRIVADQGLEVVKRFTLQTRDETRQSDSAQPYTMLLHVEVKNVGSATKKIGYRLDGPTGLPVEGFWYSKGTKMAIESGAGMRDVVYGRYDGRKVDDGIFTCNTIAKGEATVLADAPLHYIGVDSQYFTAVAMPQLADPNDVLFTRAKPVRAGPLPADSAKQQLTNVTFRLSSRAVDAAPGETPIAHDFKIYLGPKAPELLAENGLVRLVNYGWFDWVAKPMLAIMHFFYGLVGNYGIAIILLTIVVRSAMFPLSRKQALNAMKMQELQPEIKAIAKKYEKNPEQRMKAQQELFRKHNYNPFSGCMPIFVQLPIFMGLYRSLAVDVELRQAPLLNEGIRWASNMSAPDMFWFWQPYLPSFLGGEDGWLGPFLNLLPCVTIVLFIVQQKMFMPPPTDEQSAMQQKMMKYMMVVMGFMFFKVPTGLCVYFITSSVWSIAERMILPKPAPAPVGEAVLNVEAKPNGGDRRNGEGKQKRR